MPTRISENSYQQIENTKKTCLVDLLYYPVSHYTKTVDGNISGYERCLALKRQISEQAVPTKNLIS